MKLKILLSIICLTTFLLSKAQTVPYWKINGNPGGVFVPADRINTTNNFFGTAIGNNTAVRMGTAGVSRIFMQNNNFFGTSGFVGIGPNFTNPQSLLHVNSTSIQSFSQFTNATTGSGAGDGLKVGVAFGLAQINQQE